MLLKSSLFLCFFRANVFQVKLGNTSFLFKFNLTSHLSDDQIPSDLFTKFKKKMKSKYMNHQRQPLTGFLQISFMTL